MMKRSHFVLTDARFFFLIFSLSVSGTLNGGGSLLCAVSEIAVGLFVCYFLKKFAPRLENAHINDAYAFSVCGACGAAFLPCLTLSSSFFTPFFPYGFTVIAIFTLLFTLSCVIFLTKGFINSLDIVPYFAVFAVVLTLFGQLDAGRLFKPTLFIDPLLYPAAVTAFFRTEGVRKERTRLITPAFSAVVSGSLIACVVSLGSGLVFEIFAQVFLLIRCALCVITAYSVVFVGRSAKVNYGIVLRNSVMFTVMCLIQLGGSVPLALYAVLTNVPAILSTLRRRTIMSKSI